MIKLINPEIKIYLYRKEIDGRYGIDRLSGFIMAAGMNPCSNELFLFSNKNHRLLKGIFYDGVSWFMVVRRLNKGCHCWQMVGDDQVVSIDEDEFDRLLKGLPIQNICVFEEDYPPEDFLSDEELFFDDDPFE